MRAHPDPRTTSSWAPCGIPFLSTARHPPEQRPSDQDDIGRLQLRQGVLHPCREHRNPGHDHGPQEALTVRARSCGEADQIREEPAAGLPLLAVRIAA
jgi:hypothetical protein